MKMHCLHLYIFFNFLDHNCEKCFYIENIPKKLAKNILFFEERNIIEPHFLKMEISDTFLLLKFIIFLGKFMNIWIFITN